MYEYIKKIQERLTPNDKRQLSDIFAPTIVTIPDRDPWGRMTVMPDGRIRFYGEYKKKNVFDHDCDECYIESCDGGLSWKRHIVENRNVLGASAYMPFNGKYVKVGFEWNPGEADGTYAFVGNSPDDEQPKKYKISDKVYFEPRLPFVMRSRDRILCVVTERRPESHNTCYYNVVVYSDDGGETWKESPLGEAPYHEKKWPHKGYRWQQNNRECSMEELSDGSLLIHSRTATDYHYLSRSFDGGETWTDFEPSVFHSTGTMPVLKKLSDGRLMFFWCNTKLLPELATADGNWEDYFTNRDANHCAISSDDGKSWQGYREMGLNLIRHTSDFRSYAGPVEGDKSVHQFEALELPMNKMLVAYGQHFASRKMIIFDIDWLYEKQRHEDFLYGLANISAQSYVKSYHGGHRNTTENPVSFAGHCAYNRICGCLLVPSPLNDWHEVLQICSNPDPRLISPICGAVWNFPAARKGKITLSANIFGKGLRVSLLDYWMNPGDDTVEYYADFSIKLRPDMHPEGELFSDFILEFDCDKETVKITCGEYLCLEKKLSGEHPNGLCYLHMQSVDADDTDGAYIASIDFKGE